jgi:hypothetical protein
VRGGEFFGHDVVKIGGELKEMSWGLTERGNKLTMNAKEPTSLCCGRIGFSAYHTMCGGCRADRILLHSTAYRQSSSLYDGIFIYRHRSM